jgi:hypothetical protein
MIIVCTDTANLFNINFLCRGDPMSQNTRFFANSISQSDPAHRYHSKTIPTSAESELSPEFWFKGISLIVSTCSMDRSHSKATRGLNSKNDN